MKNDEKNSNNIIIFPVTNKNILKDHKKKKKRKKKIIISILTLSIPIVTTIITIITQIKLSEKSEIESRPVLDFSIQYLDGDYYEDIYLFPSVKKLNKVTIKMSDKNNDPVNISIEPFFNILYYDQRNKGIVKQLLPIHDIEGLYEPMSHELINVKNGIISEIKFNENTYEIIQQIENMFNDKDCIDYKDYKNEFDSLTIMSIDFQFYITIDYVDIYDNKYTEIYLCETGFGKPSAYLNVGSLDEENLKNDDLVKFMLECEAVFYKLKETVGETIVFDAKLTKLSYEDEIYKQFHELYMNINNTPGSIYYVPNFLTDLDELIDLQYEYDQLVFCLLAIVEKDD